MMEDVDEAWLARRYYGGDLPADAERCLHLAAATYADTACAEAHLARAAELAPGHQAVDLGHYKFHLYKAHLDQALHHGERLLDHAARGIGLNSGEGWRGVTAAQADFTTIAVAPRFFLFALKAVGYLNLRLGHADEGRAMLEKVRKLDPGDTFGASSLLAVANRREREEDDDD